MGQSMCAHLLEAGYQVTVTTRTKEKAQPLLDKGAKWAETPQEVAKNSDIIFSIVGYPQDVEEVILGEHGALSGAKEGSIIVDMTTSEPALATTIHKKAAQKGVKTLDAPVSGGDVGARDATLSIMVGGEASTFEEVYPLFSVMGKNITHMGPAGAGQHTKTANQISVAATMIGTVETLFYAYKAGLDLHQVIDVVGSGAGASFSLNKLGRRIVDGDYDPGFFIKHFIKDMSIGLKEAERLGFQLPGLSLVYEFYLKAATLGYEESGTQALYRVFEEMEQEGW